MRTPPSFAAEPVTLPAPAQRPIDFVRDVQPIFARSCIACHGPEKQKSDLRLDLKERAMKGGREHAPAIVPGKSAESPLIKFVADLDPEMIMPPAKDGGDRLSKEQISVLRAWIDQGAKWPDGVVIAARARAGLDWWSLQPLREQEPPPPPKSPKSWTTNAIDRFVLAKLNEKALRPNAKADRRTLIRRATYDLTGLPPSPKEVDDFVRDSRKDAYEKLIDRLLESPAYGEQWGRHWLDVIRFGESTGFERNVIINNLWPFRDYVIRSFNEDKPFDRMILEHLAGDVIGKDNPKISIGSAFLVAGPYDNVGNQDPVQAQIIRANTLDEIVTTTASAFLGLTVNCARCHDHKFDPITQEDYYRLQSVFAGVHHGERVQATPEEIRSRDEQLKPLNQRRDEKVKARAELEGAIIRREEAAENSTSYQLPAVDPYFAEHRFPPVNAKMVRFKVFSTDRNPKSADGLRIDEFEVWSSGPGARNVALAENGGQASGRSRVAQDFADAYGVGQVIDGKFGACWVTDSPAELTITLAQPTQIDHVVFSCDRSKSLPKNNPMIVAVGEYTIESSLDGKSWTQVASSEERPPGTPSLQRERLLKNGTTEAEKAQFAQIETDLKEIQQAIRAVKPIPTVWAGTFSQPGSPSYIQQGGDPTRKGPIVNPSSLSTLSKISAPFQLATNAPESERRLALARWLTQADNPLPPRVLANRLWHYHFGAGIVTTPGDFGYLGTRPTHPELLDYLASRIRENGWRLKSIHREIMLSQTYQQSSQWREDAAKVDASASLLWRFPPRRLSAEELRDTILSVAGKLQPSTPGPGFRLYRYLEDNVATYVPLDVHGPETFRRAVYHQSARASRTDLLTDFDAPDCAFATPSRTVTTTPLQALTLFNHQFTMDMAEFLSKRILTGSQTKDIPAQIRAAYRIAFQREPSKNELRKFTQVINQDGLPSFCRALLNSNELIYVE